MAWAYLALAAVFEVAFVLFMKTSYGFTRLWPSVTTVVGVAGGIGFLTLAMKTLPVGVAYPIWAGAGSLGAVALGVTLFGEALSPMKLLSVVVIVVGMVGLKLSEST